MKINIKTIEVLNELILGNETYGYKTMYQLVEFYKNIGYTELANSNYTSRWEFSYNILKDVNQRGEIERVICAYSEYNKFHK